MRLQAKYTEAQRAEALAYFEACGSQRQTARECGIPTATVRTWINGVKMNDDVREKVVAKKIDLADSIEALAHKLVALAPDKFETATLQQVAVALGIAVEKCLLLRNKPTAITHDVSLTDEQRNQRVAELLDAARARGIGPASPGTGAESDADPLR